MCVSAHMHFRFCNWNSVFLLRLRRIALKRGVWFKALSRIERCMVEVAARVVKRPKSERLVLALARIVVKLREALVGPHKVFVKLVGRTLARRTAEIAVKLGNRAAAAWAEDAGFIKYLTIMCLNNFLKLGAFNGI